MAGHCQARCAGCEHRGAAQRRPRTQRLSPRRTELIPPRHADEDGPDAAGPCRSRAACDRRVLARPVPRVPGQGASREAQLAVELLAATHTIVRGRTAAVLDAPGGGTDHRGLRRRPAGACLVPAGPGAAQGVPRHRSCGWLADSRRWPDPETRHERRAHGRAAPAPDDLARSARVPDNRRGRLAGPLRRESRTGRQGVPGTARPHR